MIAVLSDKAAIAFADAPLVVQKAFGKQIHFLEKNLLHPSLHAKKYDESNDISSTYQSRLALLLQDRAGPVHHYEYHSAS